MKHIPTLHIVVGLLGVTAFLLSGQYMDLVHEHLANMPDGPRMLYRSSHIYLLWSSLLNLVLGCYGRFSERRTLSVIQGAASLAVLVGPVLLVASFLRESQAVDLERPNARLAVYLAFAGVLFHTACADLSRAGRKP
ncbi:MAG: hypothetical protein KF868_06045 [Acidobacteria bacterium]|nr:hypothetical protein [Acidobacteriota bacterium]MCW5971011.1 hypothetical protein [Blastocatellales bacterium]